MMEFVMMTASFMTAIVLGTLVVFAALLNKPVLKWYMNYVGKLTNEILNESLAVSEDKDL